MQNGGVFGKRDSLVGYEYDGARLDYAQLKNGVAVATHVDQTPQNFLVLAVSTSEEGARGGDSPPDEDPDPASAHSYATMGLYSKDGGGTVFTAAVIDWARLLDPWCLATGANDSLVVQTITKNVLDKLGRLKDTPAGRSCLSVRKDFNGDGRDDLCVWYPETGEWQVALSTGTAFQATAGVWLKPWARGPGWVS